MKTLSQIIDAEAKNSTINKANPSRISLKDKTALVFDTGGLFTEAAASLKNNENGFGKVLYYVPWEDDFPSPAKQDVGKDFKGLTRIQDFWRYVPEVDIIVFFDTYVGHLANYLRKEGYRVWGGGLAEEMELDRWKMRTIQHKVGLPTQQTLRIKSLGDLELYFQGIKNKVKETMGRSDTDTENGIWQRLVKTYEGFTDKNYFGDLKRLKDEWFNGAQDKIVKGNLRGLFESFMVKEFESSLTNFNALWQKMGHRANAKDIEFIVEEKIEGVEPGLDAIQINGEYMSPTMWGIEKKGSGMLERILPYKELPDFVQKFNNKLASVIKTLYLPTSSFISFEFIFGADEKCYLIDPSVRMAAPIGAAIFSELYLNLPEIIWHGAAGEMITPKMLSAKYAAGVNFGSEWADKNELEIKYDKSIEKWLKFRKAYTVNGNTYASAGFSSVCTVIGFGNTPEEAIAKVKARAEKVHGYQLDTSTEGLDNILKKDVPELEKIIGKF